MINHIAFRESGTRRDVILIHGLGMSSAYLGHLARALFDRGLDAIAPDLPGFGDSADAPSHDAEEHARLLIEWADVLSIRDAMWVGHSHGCHVVAHVARLRPDLVRDAVYVGPLWTRARHPVPRLLRRLLIDAFREPLALYAYVIPAYWRTGLGRWLMTLHRSLPDIRVGPAIPPANAAGIGGATLVIAGERDPLPDRTTMVNIVGVPGAHACVFSNPAEVAEVIAEGTAVHSPPARV